MPPKKSKYTGPPAPPRRPSLASQLFGAHRPSGPSPYPQNTSTAALPSSGTSPAAAQTTGPANPSVLSPVAANIPTERPPTSNTPSKPADKKNENENENDAFSSPAKGDRRDDGDGGGGGRASSPNPQPAALAPVLRVGAEPHRRRRRQRRASSLQQQQQERARARAHVFSSSDIDPPSYSASTSASEFEPASDFNNVSPATAYYRDRDPVEEPVETGSGVRVPLGGGGNGKDVKQWTAGSGARSEQSSKSARNYSSGMAPFRDADILIIYPGSQTTLVQYGIPESLTPPQLHIPTRMFPALEPGLYTFTKIREAREGEKEDLIAQTKAAKAEEADDQDEAMEDADDGEDLDDGDEDESGGDKAKSAPGSQAPNTPAEKTPDAAGKETPAAEEEAELEEDELDDGLYVVDEDDDEGAVWCMKEGKVVNWPAFFALLQHIYETETPGFSSPLFFVHPPTFSATDKERLTQFVFEKLKVPGFGLYDAAQATHWAYGIPTATIIDVGYEKTDITPISDFVVHDRARTTVHDCGGENMTRHLAKLLPHFKPEDIEALKKNAICEILPLGMPIPGSSDATAAAAALVGPAALGQDKEKKDELVDEEEGSINVAAIVAAGKTREFLDQREREKRGEAERKLPNREREMNSFWVVDKKRPGEDDELLPSPVLEQHPTSASASAFPPAAGAGAGGEKEPTSPLLPTSKNAELKRQIKLFAAQGITLRDDETLRELTVGPERFRAADCGILYAIAQATHRSISLVEDPGKRADLWDNLIVAGNGSGVRGFRDALVQTLAAMFVIPPSSGTIFSSELPSSLSTPLATGQSTPQPNYAGASGPNPLLVAATTANLPPGSFPGGAGAHAGGAAGAGVAGLAAAHHSSHQQTPQSVKLASEPAYFPEWKDAGWEEIGFLGAQIAARVVFVVDNNQNHMYMNRADYNEVGPVGIHSILE